MVLVCVYPNPITSFEAEVAVVVKFIADDDQGIAPKLSLYSMYLQVEARFRLQANPLLFTKKTVPPPGPASPATQAPPFAQVAFTARVNVCCAESVTFLAVTVYVVLSKYAVGVPDNTPVEELNDMPAG